MADKKLNAVSTASDGAYIYAEDASGNQIKISKADLASVVAGIISPMIALDAANLKTANLNDVRRNAFFGNSTADGMTGFPSGFNTNYHWFGFSYFFTGDIRGFQFVFTGDTNKAYIRFYSDAWGAWNQL